MRGGRSRFAPECATPLDRHMPRPVPFAPVLPAVVLLALVLGPAPVQAHPHIFVNVSHQLLFDAAGQLVGLRARWDYDKMFTLLMIEDGA